MLGLIQLYYYRSKIECKIRKFIWKQNVYKQKWDAALFCEGKERIKSLINTRVKRGDWRSIESRSKDIKNVSWYPVNFQNESNWTLRRNVRFNVSSELTGEILRRFRTSESRLDRSDHRLPRNRSNRSRKFRFLFIWNCISGKFWDTVI